MQPSSDQSICLLLYSFLNQISHDFRDQFVPCAACGGGGGRPKCLLIKLNSGVVACLNPDRQIANERRRPVSGNREATTSSCNLSSASVVSFARFFSPPITVCNTRGSTGPKPIKINEKSARQAAQDVQLERLAMIALANCMAISICKFSRWPVQCGISNAALPKSTTLPFIHSSYAYSCFSSNEHSDSHVCSSKSGQPTTDQPSINKMPHE